MSWEKRSPLNRDQEIQIFVSNSYMIFNLVVCVCLGTAMFENRNSLTTEIDRTVQLILLLTYLIIILVLVSVVVKLILQFLKTTHYWFAYSFKEKSSNIFFTLNFCSLVFISVQLIFPNYIQLLLLIFLSISLFVFHRYISQKGIKYRVTNSENLILMCNIVFLILCLLSSRSEFLLLSGLGFTYFFIRNPKQLLIVFSKDSEFKYCALAFTVSGLFGLISIALYFVGFSLFVMPCIALANISQSAAYILRIKHNLNFDITSLIFNRDKLKKRLSDEEYLVDACKMVSQILNKLFGESYANSLIKYSFHLNKKTKMNELKTKGLSVYFGQLNQLKPSESKANKKLVKKLSPWLYSLKSDELLNYPVTTVPWKKRSLLRYVMEGQLEPIEKKIKRLRIITYLKSHFLFTYFDEVQIKKVSNYIEAQFYKPNETVFSEGDLGRKLYLIVDGVFEVFKRETSDDENIMIELSKKDFIGEQSLLKHQFQNTSIRAKTDGLMLSLDARVFSSLIKKDLSMLRKYVKVIDDLWFIKSNELFRNYTNESLSPIVNAFKHKSFKMGRYVFKEGDVGDEFYIIRNGEVGVYLKRKSTPLALLSIGEFFGEIALLKNTPRTASIKTITETETLSLSRESLNRIMSDDLNLQSSLEFLSDQRLSKQN
jgi:CRP-like cAMP-binding protein